MRCVSPPPRELAVPVGGASESEEAGGAGHRGIRQRLRLLGQCSVDQELSRGEQMMPVRPAARPDWFVRLGARGDRPARDVAERLPLREALPKQGERRRFPLQIGVIDGPVQRCRERLGKRFNPIVSPIHRLPRLPEPLRRRRQRTLRAIRVPLGLVLVLRLPQPHGLRPASRARAVPRPRVARRLRAVRPGPQSHIRGPPTPARAAVGRPVRRTALPHQHPGATLLGNVGVSPA